jgi:glycosyltransferase involved in cell wall biosynthesis
MKTKKKLLILYGPLLHYRVGLFNELSKDYDLTVVTTKSADQEYEKAFRIIQITPKTLWRFKYLPGLASVIATENYEACIVFLDIENLSYLTRVWLETGMKKIVWGPWKTKSQISNWVRTRAMQASDAVIFYCHQHTQGWGAGFDPKHFFVAQNTIEVKCRAPAFELKNRNLILVVGTLDQRKGIDVLIRSFAASTDQLPPEIAVQIIGNGPEEKSLRQLVRHLGLQHRVLFMNANNDDEVLCSFYSKAIVSVGLKQAGLSVLQSMGHGVPFLTARGSVSGGEKFNIFHGVTGIISNPAIEEISQHLVRLCNDQDLANTLGRNALSHYQAFCTMANYARGFSDAIEGRRTALVNTQVDWRHGT